MIDDPQVATRLALEATRTLMDARKVVVVGCRPRRSNVDDCSFVIKGRRQVMRGKARVRETSNNWYVSITIESVRHR